ncbi:hypothetical protein [Streptomyces boninensis]|uniref:hypothetical protein n=1 Tax=Streptomyces boninensis TaxID=2039455 RepID=UPI003B21FC9C
MRLAFRLALVLAFAFTGFAGWTYAQARSDDDLSYAKTRDAALSAARTHIATLNSMDGARVGDGVRRWRAASTGALETEIGRNGTKSAKVLAQEGTTARGTVTDAALTDLDERAGTATAIATVRVEVEPRNGEAKTDRKRFQAELERTKSGWKLASLGAVPVGKG